MMMAMPNVCKLTPQWLYSMVYYTHTDKLCMFKCCMGWTYSGLRNLGQQRFISFSSELQSF